MHFPTTSKNCHYCKKHFNSAANVRTHIRKLHKPKFSCPEEDCDFQFIMYSEYKRHYITKHTIEKQYFCPLCDKGYKYEGHCKTHISNCKANTK